MTDAGALDVLHDMPSRDGTRLTYQELAPRSTSHLYPSGVTIRAAGLVDIVASKEWADRPKDHEALDELRRLVDAPRPRPQRLAPPHLPPARHSRDEDYER